METTEPECEQNEGEYGIVVEIICHHAREGETNNAQMSNKLPIWSHLWQQKIIVIYKNSVREIGQST